MKKIILLTLTILMISNVALACGGITIHGKSGKNYCFSKFPMNWYTAYAWCKDQGMDLIELDTTCGTTTPGTLCTEFSWSSDEKALIKKIAAGMSTYPRVWTNTSVNSYRATYIDIIDTIVANNTNVNRPGAYFALCR